MSIKLRGFNSLEKNYSKLDPSTRWKEVLPSGGSTSIWWNASIWWKLTTTELALCKVILQHLLQNNLDFPTYGSNIGTLHIEITTK